MIPKIPSKTYKSSSCVNVSVGDSCQTESKQSQYGVNSTHISVLNDANCCDNWWNIPMTYNQAGTCNTNPSYNPWYVKTENCYF